MRYRLLDHGIGRICPLGALLMACAGPITAAAQATARAADDTMHFGGLTRLGMAKYQRVSASRDGNSLMLRLNPLYQVRLYADSAALYDAWNAFRGRAADALLKDDRFHRTVREAKFPVAVRLTATRAFTGDQIAQEFATDLGNAAGSRQFLDYFQTDVKEGDEIVIQFAEGEVVKMVAFGREWPEIRNQRLVRALLATWIGKDELSGMKNGLLANALAWLR
jgi:hypothetical protein